jgi:hypothetical protein
MDHGNRCLRHLTRVCRTIPGNLLVRLVILVFRIVRLVRRFFAAAALA